MINFETIDKLHLPNPEIDLFIQYVDSNQVLPGITCHNYQVRGSKYMDLALVHMHPGTSTPLQKVTEQCITMEYPLRGNGNFFHKSQDSSLIIPAASGLPIYVLEGDEMQWQADNQGLVFAEICWPPYKTGRFTDLT